MISVKNAIHLLEENLNPLNTIQLPLLEALGHFLSNPIYSKIHVPNFDNSAMDGYALLLDPSQTHYTIQCSIQAGDQQEYTIEKNNAARIFTGAPIPKNVNCVIAQEQVEVINQQIKINPEMHAPFDHIRKVGSQCKPGDLVAEKNCEITPSLIGLLASLGIEHVEVYEKPTVGIIITGNELTEPGNPLTFGKIYNSNQYSLISLLHSIGIISVETYHCDDNLNDVSKTVKNSISKNSITLVTGGISVGEFDFVLQSLKDNEINILFHRVKQKPGKPIGVGIKNNHWIFALPGNPAAVITCFNQYVKPSILSLMGRKNSFQPIGELPVLNEFYKKPGLTHFLKAHYSTNGVSLLGSQESFNLLAFNQANCIVEIPEDVSEIQTGTLLPVYPL